MKYPKKVTIKNDKLKGLLEEKSKLVDDGRKLSDELEQIEIEMLDIDKEIQDVEKTVDISDIEKEIEAVTEEMKAIMKKSDGMQQLIYARMKAVVPEEIVTKYEKLSKKKESIEENRRKIGLRIQKYSDKIIPITRKEMARYLTDKYEDYETIKLENGIIVGTIFSHLNDFENRFNSKK